jgi:translation initiation factor 6
LTVFLFNLWGSPNIGVYSLVTDSFAIVPVGVPKTKVEKLRNYLKVKVIPTNIGGSRLIGALAAANSNGIILPHFAYDDDIKSIQSMTNVNVKPVKSKKTAFGNLILANDHGAIVDPRLTSEVTNEIKEILGVEVVPGEIACLPYVGSLAVATNKGVLTHPMLREEERKLLQEVLKVPVDVGTVNCGVPFVGSGLIANSHSAVAGSVTTGPEVVIIGQALGVV